MEGVNVLMCQEVVQGGGVDLECSLGPGDARMKLAEQLPRV